MFHKLVVIVHQHDAVIHDNTCERHHAEDGNEGEVVPHHQMTEDGTEKTKWYGGQNDEGLNVTFQLHGQHDEDDKECDHQIVTESGHVLALIAGAAFFGIRQAGKIPKQSGKQTCLHQCVDIIGGCDGFIHLSRDGCDASPVNTADRREASCFGDFRHREKRGFRTIGQAHPHVIKP